MEQEYDFDVYISYDSPNKPIAFDIGSRLQRGGLRVWINDWMVKPGESQREISRAELLRIKNVIALISSEGVHAPAQIKELGIARSIPGLKIIPVLLPGAMSDDLPDFLRGINWVDFGKGISSYGLNDLFVRLGVEMPIIPNLPSTPAGESSADENFYEPKAAEDSEGEMELNFGVPRPTTDEKPRPPAPDGEGGVGWGEKEKSEIHPTTPSDPLKIGSAKPQHMAELPSGNGGEDEEAGNGGESKSMEPRRRGFSHAKPPTREELPKANGGKKGSPKALLPVRVLNANFADPLDKIHTLPVEYCLEAGREYDLRVDIGPRWLPSLFKDEKTAVFPDQVVKNKLLTAEDRKRGAFDVQVVFVSEDFTPNLVSAIMNVPVDPSQRSIPYIKGKLAKKAGWVSLHVRAPKPRDIKSKRIITAFGRLSVYYRNNLLQSAAIKVGIGIDQGLKLNNENSGIIDFVLSSGFDKVEKNLATRRVNLGPKGKKLNKPIAVNLALNDDGSGRHRIIAKYYDNTRKKDVPPAWAPYDPKSAEQDLNSFRDLLKKCYKGLNNNFGKSGDAFKEDLKNLAIFGYKLWNRAIIDVKTEDGKLPPEWLNSLKNALGVASVIQVARTGSANYAFPWALIYQYPMSGPEYKFCKILEEWSDKGERKKPIEDHCRYENDPDWNHSKGNIVCPYGFWGLKHIVEQPLSGDIANDKTSNDDKRILTSKKVAVSVAVTDALEKPILNLRKVHISNLANNANIRMDPQKPAQTLDEVLAMLRAPEVIYFLCHGEYQKEKAEGKTDRIVEPYLSIGSGKGPKYWIDPGLWADYSDSFDIKEWVKHRPLVFINGCHTTAMRPGVVLNFLSTFRNLGASGIIGTEISLWADMAMIVGESLLTKITSGMAVGDAIREMRWELVNKGNMLGLAYTPYCLADLHIEAKGG